MAAAIRYLSADNHAADSPPVKLAHHRPISDSSLKGRLGFFRYLAKCGYLVSGVTDRAGGNIPAFPPCVFTYTLPLLAHSTLWKHNFMPVKYRIQFKNICHTLHTHHRKVELWKPQKKIQTYYIYSFKSMYVCLKVSSNKYVLLEDRFNSELCRNDPRFWASTRGSWFSFHKEKTTKYEPKYERSWKSERCF